MIVAVALFELHIEFAQSLKEKRMVVRSLRAKLRDRFEISAAEVAFQDVHQRARMAISFVTGERIVAEGLLEKIQTFIDANTDAITSSPVTTVTHRTALARSQAKVHECRPSVIPPPSWSRSWVVSAGRPHATNITPIVRGATAGLETVTSRPSSPRRACIC